MSDKKIIQGIPFFPHQLLREAVVVFMVLGALLLLASKYPASLLEPANPYQTPAPIYPEWYFLYVFGFLKFWTLDIGPIPAKTIGITFSMVLWYLLLIAVPFIDRNPETDPRRRPIATALGVLVLLGILFFTYYGIVHGE